jgi:lipoprotein-anchoring transpeptidase ErfK/SrfK
MSSSPNVRILLLGLTLLVACGDEDGPVDPAPAGDAPTKAAAPVADEAGGDPPEADDDAVVLDDGDEPEPEPEPDTAPGKLVPPPAESLTVHGLASFEVVTIYTEPKLTSTKLGYLRFGHRTMVTPKVADQGEGCPKGWYQLPAGGYACASKGLTVDATKEPYMYHPPPRPRIDDPMPYDYGAVARDGTETWWRPADPLERELAAEKYRILQEQLAEAEAAAAAAAAADGTLPPAPKKPKKAAPAADDDGAAADDDGAPADDGAAPADPPAGDPPALPSVDEPDEPAEPAAPPTAEELAEQRRKEAEAKAKAEEERLRKEEERKVRLAKMNKLPLHPEHPFLERGFTITTALKVSDQGKTWWRTSRGGYLEANKIARKGKPETVQLGVVLPEGAGFPFGFVDDKAAVFEKNEDGRLKFVRSLPRRTFVGGTEEVVLDGKTYVHTAEDTYVRTSDLRMAVPQPVPEDLGGIDRWIDVDLGKQLLVAYEGERPVFTTLVSTGRRGTKDEPFETPTGTFRIQTKHISSSMDGNTASDGNYSIQDVPWAMFFEGNYALHGAFWHNGFGSRKSHGCINLAVGDARWLFWWVGPDLPEGWHGAAAREGSPGSVVVVR